jgi:hydrogenase maturation protein HypF
VACAACGPRSGWNGTGSETQAGRSARRRRDLLKEGNILAIKGIGGFHLACDATNPQAIATFGHARGVRRNPSP